MEMEGHTHIQMHAYALPSWHEFLNKPPENVCKHTAKHFCTPPLTAWQSVCMCVLESKLKIPLETISSTRALKHHCPLICQHQ